MAFELKNVVPWGRNLEEYQLMFQLNETDSKKRIADFGGGPAGFNYEATAKGYQVTSFDPIYQFSKEEIKQRIEETRVTVMKQMRANRDGYVWTKIKNLDELENIRMSAMQVFLSDFEDGKREKRYIYHELPDKLPFEDNAFDIGLSSHFLLMYTLLGYDFHIKAISEMLRVCKEVRIFPLLNLAGENAEMIVDVIGYFEKHYTVKIQETEYEFQKGGNRLLIISK